jgi:excinuclease ABC subunit C
MGDLFERLEFSGFGPSRVLPAGCETVCGQIKKNGPGGLKHQVKVLVPKEPGIYGIVDSSGILIYVGKAKNLRKRLQSYFLKKKSKEKKLIRRAALICWQVCFSEFHAFLREIEVINLFLPSANVMGVAHRLRPIYLVLTSSEAPAIKLRKKLPRKYMEAYGPINRTKSVNKALVILNETLGLRDCAEKTPINFANQKSLIELLPQFGCMRHEIGNCLGPCGGGCSRPAYMARVSQIKEFLNGEVGPVVEILRKQMSEFANRLHFEFAGLVKQKIQTLEFFGQILQRAKNLGQLNFLYWQKLKDGQFVLNIIHEGVLIHSEIVEHFKTKDPLSKSLIEKIKRKVKENTQVSWVTFQKLIIQRWFKKMKNEMEQTCPLPKI